MARATAGTDFSALDGREIIIEVSTQGAHAVVAAVDAATGVEVLAMGPVQAPASDLERLALGKLQRRLLALGVITDAAAKRRKPPRSRRGVVV